MNTQETLKARIYPHISADLLRLLDEAFPIHDAVPRLNHPIEATWLAAGARQLIDFLQSSLEEHDPITHVSSSSYSPSA